MMSNLRQVEYVQVNRENLNDCVEFLKLGYEYMKETASEYSLKIHEKFLNSILNKQGEKNRWLILLKIDDVAAGFVHAKIDMDDRVGWGYIMEFYIYPEYRRMRLGTKIYNFIKYKFVNSGVKDIWLTADKITGEPFWFSIGFTDTGEIENNKKILVISV